MPTSVLSGMPLGGADRNDEESEKQRPLASPPTSVTQPPPALREFGDNATTRRNIYQNVLQSAQSMQPVANQRHTLELSDVAYKDPEEFSKAERKRAILENRTLGRRMIGTWRLKDNESGQVLDERKQTVAVVPHLSDSGTFVHNGVEYTLSHQQRLRPGVFARRKDNGELESHINVKPGTGPSHRISMDPETGIFKLGIGQAKIPLITVMKSLGATDGDLRELWGNELAAANMQRDDPATLNKLYRKLVRNPEADAGPAEKREALSALFQKMELDPEVTQRTLGQPFKNVGLDTFKATTKKLLAINRGEAETDDRDHQAYQKLMGPEDIIAERLGKNVGQLRLALWRASGRGDLKNFKSGVFTDALRSALLSTGLGQAAEEVNPAELLDHQTRVTRMGEGGIPSMDAVPDEARGVQPSQFGFIDLVRTPESGKVGVDLRFARAARKGSDGRLYTRVHSADGAELWKSPQDLVDSTVALPGEMSRDAPMVNALSGGRIKKVPKKDVQFSLPSMEDTFSPLANMVPMKSMMKAQRAVMASRMLTQALPLTEPEAPLVQSAVPGTDGAQSFEELYADKMGVVRADEDLKVLDVQPDKLVVQGKAGKREIELYNNHPFNRKTFLHNTPAVRPGDTVKAGDLLARSNFSTQDGTTALGLNARVAYVPYKGMNFEDATVISDSMAKRLSSEHMYQRQLDLSEEGVKADKKSFMSIFPGQLSRRQLSHYDDNGMIKPDTVVHEGDPLILAVKKREQTKNRLNRGRKSMFADVSVTWDHESPGIVTDVVRTPKGAAAVVKSIDRMKPGDKLCYDPETRVLTRDGWKQIADVTLRDEIASLRKDGRIVYQRPAAIHRYRHRGRMYRLQTTQVDLLVTDNHNLYAKPRRSREFGLHRADALSGRRYRLKRNGVWQGESPAFVTLPGTVVAAGQGGRGSREIPPIKVPVRTYLMLLGMFLSEGNIVNQPRSGSYGFDLTQIKEPNRTVLLEALTAAGIRYCEHGLASRIRVYGLQWLQHFHQFGCAEDKFIPTAVFDYATEDLEVLYEWLMWGDGARTGSAHSYCTVSRRLADDVQRLALHLGMSANVTHRSATQGNIKGVEYVFQPTYRVGIYRTKNEPTVNHGHARQQSGQDESWVDYDGDVYCVTLPRHHVMYVQRNGKPVWCGNSGRYGDKGIVADVVPDDEMPQDAQGRPFEVLLNPLGMISRSNPAQIVEAALGKIAEKTGRPVKVPDFDDTKDMAEWALGELKKHGLTDVEDIVDPEREAKIKGVMTGNRFFMKLHHTAEGKGQARGFSSYTAEQVPAKGGEAGAKRVGMLELGALLSHGATDVIRDASVIRGQENPQYWQQFMSGYKPPTPKVPHVYEKFINSLKGAGINAVREGTNTHIMALTNKDIGKLAGRREVKNVETVDWKNKLQPIKGGLFDEKLTGGHNGNRWSFIKLHEPMPNPVMEEPIRRVLGLTKKQFEGVLSGREEFQGKSGPEAISTALDGINMEREISRARTEVKGSKKTARDAAIRRLAYLKSADRMGLHPRDWILDKVPVLPPAFRPVSTIGANKLPMVSDPNFLYKEVFEANQSLKDMSEKVDDVSDERLATYNAFKAVSGLGDPIHPKNQERRVKGILKHVFGQSPKFGMVQRRLLGSAADLVGRAVISPNPDLDMDHVGLPETKAWEVYKPFIVRRLVKHGFSRREAAQAAKDRSATARKALVSEMEDRPLVINRAPTLHRYGMMAFRPKLTKSETLQVSPLIVGGFGADFDGDAMQYHVPADDAAVDEAYNKMLPSRNLFAASNFDVHYTPSQEYVGGLWRASRRSDRPDKKKPRRYRNAVEAVRAYKRGEIDIDQAVDILEG